MATRTSTTSGNWATGGTWVGGVAPVDGDSAIIDDGHTVTVAANATIGTSGVSNTDDVTCNGTGALIIAEDVKFTCKGGIFTHGGGLTLNAGAWIEFVVPTSRLYTCRVGYYADASAHFVCNGTAAKRCKISVHSGGGTAILSQNVYDGGGNTHFTYTDLDNLGVYGEHAVYVINDLVMQHCRVTNCSEIWVNSISTTQHLDVQYCNFSAGKGDEYLYITTDSDPTGLTRRCRYNSFQEGSAYYSAVFYESRGLDVDGNYFGVPPLTSIWASNYVYHWANNFINNVADFSPVVATITNDYAYNPDLDNNHPYVTQDISQTYDGIVLESGTDWAVDVGDSFLSISAVSSARTYTVRNCVILPSPGRHTSFSLFSCGGLADVTFRVSNNTFFAAEYGGGYLTDDNLGHAGEVEYFRDNLGWADVGSANAYLLHAGGSVANNYVTSADYNGYLNLSTPRYNVPSNGFAATPGTHDLSADPTFVDNTRALATWSSTVLHNTGTAAELRTAALAAFAAMNDETAAAYVAGLAVADMVTWIKAGFAPTNMAFNTAGHAGGYIGAVVPVAPVTVSDVPMLLMAAL